MQPTIPNKTHVSTASSINSTPANNAITVELVDLVNSLLESPTSSQKAPSLGSLRLQCDDLRRIRQLLIDNHDQGQARDAFRHVGGFKALLDVIRSLAGFYNGPNLSRDERIEFFELLKAVLHVLSEALHEHAVNRRVFKVRVHGGGWDELQRALAATGVADFHPSDLESTFHAMEQMMGMLLAFALGEESSANLLRGLANKFVETQRVGDVADEASESTGAVMNGSPEIEDAIRKHIRRQFNGNEVLRNPEIIPVVLYFWQASMGQHIESHETWNEALALAVPISLQQILSMSIRNQVAMHGARVLRLLFPVCFDNNFPPHVKNSVRRVIETLLRYGIDTLDDSYQLFRYAVHSADAAEVLLGSMDTSQNPPFIQFDLSMHGFSYLELPTLGPPFPPPSGSSGYTLMTWVRFDKFDVNDHTTIFGLGDQSRTCFLMVYLEKDSKQLILQTSVTATRPSVRFRSAPFQLDRWYHIVIVHRRPKTNQSRAALFVDGHLVDETKCLYPTRPPPLSSSTESFASMTGTVQQYPPIRAFLGTPQDVAIRLGRDMVDSKWSMATFHLFQEAITLDLIAVYQKLGPRYVGNFQDCLGSFQTYKESAEVHLQNETLHPGAGQSEKSDMMAAIRQRAGMLLPESKILLSFSPSAVLDNDDRNHVNESKLIKSLSRDAAKTVQHLVRASGNSVIVNTAIPSYNDALTRPQGVARLVGEPVVCAPQSLDDTCWRIGGSAAAVLRLLDIARTKDEVLRAVQIVFRSLQGNWRNSEAMERENGYGVLAGLMREKLGFGSVFSELGSTRLVPVPVDVNQREELALELLRSILKFVGYDEVNPDESLLINGLAYRFLLIDFDTWRRAPIATQKLYYSQFVHFAARGRHHKFNAKRLYRMRIVKRLLDALKGESFSADVFPDFLEAFCAVFRCSISTDTLRSFALFITYALQDKQASTHRATRISWQKQDGTNGRLSSPASRERSASRNSPFKLAFSPSSDISRFEIGVQMLEAYSDILCEPETDIIHKFASTVTNKWLLFLLAEHDPRVIFFTVKILTQLLYANGRSYAKKFENAGCFIVLKQRLRSWWAVPTLWIALFAMLFGQDVSTINFDEDFNQFALSEMFSACSGRIACPEVLPVLTAMLEYGLRSFVQSKEAETSRPDLTSGLDLKYPVAPNRLSQRSLTPVHLDATRSDPKHDAANNAIVLKTVIHFLADLQLKWANFRDFSATSNFVQELLFALYPAIVTSDSVSADTELNSRGSALTFEGQDVVIRPHVGPENSRPPVVRSATALPQSQKPDMQRAAQFKRASSFILVTGANDDGVPAPARFNAILTPATSGSSLLRLGNTLVEGLLDVVINVFIDQLFYRKDFSGFGLFLKVPPGFQEHQVYFESYVLSHAMTTLSNKLKQQQELLCETRVITNVSKYIVFMAEAIFEGWFLNGADQLLDFVGQALEYLQRPDIASIKNVRLCASAVMTMKTVFLRISLLRLSDLDDKTEEKATVAFLEKMTYWQTIILSPETSETHYLRLIFYLLYFKVISKVTAIRIAAINFWRILLVQKPDEATHILNQAAPSNQKYLPGGFLKLSQLDDEAFLVWVDHHRPELDGLFLGSLTKHWEDFLADERQRSEETAKNRIGKRKDRLRSWYEEELTAENDWRKHENATSHWKNNVYSAERLKHQRSHQDQQDSLNFTASTLEKFDRVLKGPCALFDEDSKPKWRLDETEGQNRMRLRILPDRSIQQDDYQPKRKSSEIVHRQSSTKIEAEPVTSANISLAGPTAFVQEPATILEPGRQRSSTVSGLPEDEYEIIEDPKTDEEGFEDKNRKVLRALQHGDVIQHVCNVSRIVGLEALEGLLIIGKNCLYLMDHFFQRADGEVVSVWQAPAEERDSYVQMISGKETKLKKPRSSPGERTTRHWRWPDVMLISKRRFVFRDVAIEIFFTDGRSYLLTAISPQVRNDLFSRLVARAPLLNNPAASLHPEDLWRLESLRHPEEAPQSFGSRMSSIFNSAASNPATRRWMRGEISNFAYLMLVNTMAGRTFNDLTQYPVFPWILADYKSEELDLTDPRTFRDLSKPMGCQIPSREAEFRERYQTYAEMADETAPPFHYGTHYSSAMIVSSYLIRLQPFVKSYLLLQGGSFDHADRLFYSIERTWLSASRDTTTDVRELTPEFYYLPEFLMNMNNYNFGNLQASGDKIDHVDLPPWAKGDPHIFIEKHREALESPYVSMHLHKWIDLVFGFKQLGEAAIEATNVFHHLSYHGAKDLDAIEDEVERLATIGIIHNFGQTPLQVFQKAHPQRDDGSHSSRSGDLNVIIKDLASGHTPLFECKDRVASLTWLSKSERVIASGPFQLLIPPTYDKSMDWGFSDGSLRFYSTDGKKLLALYEHFHIGPPSAATFVDSRTLVTAGSDAVITVWNVAHANKTIEVQQRVSLFGHRHAITTLAASKSLSALLSADSSGRVLLWDLNRGEFVRELESSAGELRAAQIGASTGDITLCVGRSVKVYSLNGHLLLERDVCDEKSEHDHITTCAWYEGIRGEWVERILLFTGHKSGVTKVWAKVIDATGKWTLQLVRRLAQTPRGVLDNHRVPITCILPLSHAVYIGDDVGRVYEWSFDGE